MTVHLKTPFFNTHINLSIQAFFNTQFKVSVLFKTPFLTQVVKVSVQFKTPFLTQVKMSVYCKTFFKCYVTMWQKDQKKKRKKPVST